MTTFEDQVAEYRFTPTPEFNSLVGDLAHVEKKLVLCRLFLTEKDRLKAEAPTALRSNVFDAVLESNVYYLNGEVTSTLIEFDQDTWPVFINCLQGPYVKMLLGRAFASGAAGLYFGFSKNYLDVLDGRRVIRKDGAYGENGEVLYFMPKKKLPKTYRTNRMFQREVVNH